MDVKGERMTLKDRLKALATDEILTVSEFAIEGNEALILCPHCKRVLGLRLPVRGEQFKDLVCEGMFEVDYSAKRLRTFRAF